MKLCMGTKINPIRKYFPIVIPGLLFVILVFVSAMELIDTRDGEWLKQMKKAEASIVLLNNASQSVPIKSLADNRIASVNFGSQYASEFDSILSKYTTISRSEAEAYSPDSVINKLNTGLKFFQTIIVQLTDVSVNDPQILAFLSDIKRNRQLIVFMNGSASSLKLLDTLNCPVVWAEEKSAVAANMAAQIIFGGVGAFAKLTEDISPIFRKGSGYSTVAVRLKYTVPEECGINGPELQASIDQIINEAISARATPGAAVMVVKDGKVIFNKAYGFHTYQNTRPERIDDIFDVASVTKISATTIAAMRLYERGKLSLTGKLGTYLPLARTTSKSNLSIKELMLHEAGLTPFIPFYMNVSDDSHSLDSSAFYSVKVADGYYLRHNYYEDIMLPRMLNTRLQTRGRYEYSDLSMYFLKEAIERQAKEHLDWFVLREFYQPLGMQTAGFNPRNRFDKSRIVPTEQDNYFRKTLLEGYVHDQGAAMAGGVAGHAGLFASTNDLAILFQMLLNGGQYGGIHYFNPQTINLFTSRQSLTSRRGLGFDKWDPEVSKKYPSEYASPETYGHTGYTGTCVWVDPKYKLIYIFLSNRVHPLVTNKLSSLRIRARVQDAVYQAIAKVGK